MTVVDLVQSGIALLLLCLNLADVRLQFTPLRFAHGSATFPQISKSMRSVLGR